MRRDISAHDCTRPDYGPFTDGHVRQDHAVWPDEDVILNHNFPIADRPARTRVKVRNDRSSEADNAIIANRYVFRMCFVEIDELTDEDLFPNAHSAQPVQPRAQAVPAWRDKGNFAGESPEQNRQSQTFSVLPLRRRSGTRLWAGESASNLNVSYSIHWSVFPLRRTLTGA
jgi:hypothetical protein